MAAQISSDSSAGSAMCSASTLSSTTPAPAPAMDWNVPICPTRPAVPMPANTPALRMSNSVVASGPRIAEASVGGTRISGWRRMLGTCSIDVPRPCAIRPPTPFSRNDVTAKPTICAQQPTVAAPAAN